MKSFMSTLKQTFQAGKGELLVYGVCAVGGGIFGVILSLIIIAANAAEGTYATIGALLALVLGIFIILLLGILSMQQDFNLMISFGKTRRQYVPVKYFLLVASCLVCILVAIIFALLEEFIYPALNPGAICAFSIKGFLLNPITILGFVFLVPMVVMLCGALYLRFAMKFFWVGWVLWMSMCILAPKLISAAHDEADSIWKRMGIAVSDFFGNLNDVKAVIGILVIGVVGLLGAFKLLSKQRVTL